MNIPIISLKVEGMRHEVHTALTNYEAQMDQYVRETIDEVCSESNIRQLIKASVASEMNDAIKRAAESFYRYGDGNKIIAELVVEKLKKEHSLP